VTPRRFSDHLVHEVPVLKATDDVETAVEVLVAADVPALPVEDRDGRYAGVFGEREFLSALFPSYLDQLGSARFVTRSLEAALEKRLHCRHEPVGRHALTEHVEVGPDFSDAQVAETFLHHRVLIVPVVDDGRVRGVITRAAFFRSLAAEFLAGG
jgi:CBS domain-containing protein